MTESGNGTIRAYNAIHELYDAETRDFWQRFPQETVKKFASLLPGKEIVDLGSGPGRDAVILKEMGLFVTCVDGSERMIEMTKKLGFKSILADLRTLELEKDSFSGAWAYSSLIHLPFDEARKLLEKVYISLKKDGLLFLGLIEGDGNETTSVAGSDYKRYFEYYSRGKLEALITGIPFKIFYESTFQPGNHVYLHYILKKN